MVCFHQDWSFIKEKYDLAGEEISGVLQSLIDLNLLVPQDGVDFSKIRDTKIRWSNLGWSESFDYHLLTLDYPFVDYKTTKGHKADALRMKIYEQEKSDQDRYKEYSNVQFSMKCNDIRDYLASLATEFPFPTSDTINQEVLDVDTIKKLATVVYGILRTRRPFGAQEAADLFRKTSPSGGARHPTELYMMVLNVQNMRPGLYHYNMGKNTLDYLKELPEPGFESNLEGLFREENQPQALFLMTSVFSRNRYRYREPRTLRTIYMDVGHLSMTLKCVAESLGLKCFFHHGIREEWLEDYIGIGKYEEGFMLGASLKGVD